MGTVFNSVKMDGNSKLEKYLRTVLLIEEEIKMWLSLGFYIHPMTNDQRTTTLVVEDKSEIMGREVALKVREGIVRGYELGKNPFHRATQLQELEHDDITDSLESRT